MEVLFESVPKFSKRIGLPETLVRCLVKQGKLPHVRGNKHVQINIPASLDALKALSAATAEEIAATMPVPMTIRPASGKRSKPENNRKYRGRVPDAIRLRNKEGASLCKSY